MRAWRPEANVGGSIVVHWGGGSGDPLRPAAGMALYRLTRFSSLAEPGQVLISHTTAALLEGDRHAPTLRNLGERAIPDFDAPPAQVYELPEAEQLGAQQ